MVQTPAELRCSVHLRDMAPAMRRLAPLKYALEEKPQLSARQ